MSFNPNFKPNRPPNKFNNKRGNQPQLKGPGGVIMNDNIRAFKIMLLDEEGEKLGTFSKDEALQKGFQAGQDVIQIGFNAKDNVAVAKLMEVGKYLYQQKKEKAEKKKTQKSKGMKEIKFSYAIGEHDLDFKLNKAKEFLQDGYNVKFIAVLRGRENVYKNKSFARLKDIENKLEDYGKSQGIKEERNGYSMILFAKLK